MVRMSKQIYTPHWSRRTYSQEEFIAAWTSSRSLAQCARMLGLDFHGSTNRTLKSTAESLGLTAEHMLGQGWNKPEQPDNRFGKHNGSKRPIEYYLVENGQMSSSSLKERLLKEGLLEPKCAAPHCPHPITTIDGLTGEERPTPLTLDHINGINNDNRLENLRLLCANCDRFNPTFCRGNGTRKSKVTNSKLKNKCECGNTKYYKATRCNACYLKYRSANKTEKIRDTKIPCSCGNLKDYRSIKCSKCEEQRRKEFVFPYKTKIDWPTDEELLQMVNETSFLATGKSLGVSDNAVRKRLKNRGLVVDKHSNVC